MPAISSRQYEVQSAATTETTPPTAEVTVRVEGVGGGKGGGRALLTLPQSTDMFLGPVLNMSRDTVAFVFREKPRNSLQFVEPHFL